jgi:hypothetical protein
MDFRKHAPILAVIDKLRQHGSRAGKTHLQKTLFLAGTAFMETSFEFVLYKHGPYSFDMEHELEQMRSYGAITVEPASDGYDVFLLAGEMAPFVRRGAPLTPQEQTAIDRACAFVDSKNVAELERLATAAWIRTQEGITDGEGVALRLHELKPHIPVQAARQADLELTHLLDN